MADLTTEEVAPLYRAMADIALGLRVQKLEIEIMLATNPLSDPVSMRKPAWSVVINPSSEGLDQTTQLAILRPVQLTAGKWPRTA